uniref:Neural proliferation, differentiation and control, 1b n=1 Tax=Sinocyclocheilus rhinocerous TaxID=307959 RepID=A0A673LM48_9TELE
MAHSFYAYLAPPSVVGVLLTFVGHCPRSLDCARERRHFCQPGSSHCGPCLDPFLENKRGKCVIRRRNHPGEMQRDSRLAQKVDYPAFGLIGSSSYDSGKTGDKTLAQSAQMYHFQLQKQQMMSLKQRNDSKIPESGATSDEENEDGDFTVYECPGLAPTGEMEVKNPLFDDSTFHLPLQRSYN